MDAPPVGILYIGGGVGRIEPAAGCADKPLGEGTHPRLVSEGECRWLGLPGGLHPNVGGAVNVYIAQVGYASQVFECPHAVQLVVQVAQGGVVQGAAGGIVRVFGVG